MWNNWSDLLFLSYIYNKENYSFLVFVIVFKILENESYFLLRKNTIKGQETMQILKFLFSAL